jgi:hypothetical protein
MILYTLLSALFISMLYGAAHAAGSQYSGQWTLTSCTPANSTTCSTIFTPVNEIYYVADNLQNTLYVIPYSPVNSSIISLTYNVTTVYLPPSSSCVGTWTNSSVTATCSDGSRVSITCNFGPCKSSPGNPSSNINGTWSTTSYCNSYESTCSSFFGPIGSNYTITVNGGSASLSSSITGTVSLQTYSDGSLMAAGSSELCFGSPLQSSKYRVICGRVFEGFFFWAGTDFQCVSGACLASPSTTHQPSGASITSIESLVTVTLVTLLLFFFNIY